MALPVEALPHEGRPADTRSSSDILLVQNLGVTKGDAAVADHYRLSLHPEARLRWRWIELGVGAEWKTSLVWNAVAAHVSLGPVLLLGPMRISGSAVLGYRHYPDWGKGFLNGNPGASATMPYFGGRVSCMYELVRRDLGTAWLGFTLDYDDDLHRKHFDYTYVESSWIKLFDNPDQVKAGHQDIGAGYWTLGLAGAISFDL